MDSTSTDVVIRMPINEQRLVAIIVFLISFPGFILNVIVAVFTRRLSSLNNPFGRMMASQASGEALISAVFAFYFSPMVYFQIKPMEELSLHPGFVLLIAYDICIWSHLFIATNRLFAICFPLRYDSVFSHEHTFHFIAASWLIPIITAVVLYKYFPCDLFYWPQFWVFGFSQNETCKFISWYIDYYKDLAIIIMIAFVDFTTLFQVHRLTRLQIGQTTAHQVARRKREINFFKQVVLQDLLFVLELQSYFIIAWWYVEYKWIVFFFTTVAFNLLHFFDPIIVITFNREFRLFCMSPKKMITTMIHNDQISMTPTPQIASTSPANSMPLAPASATGTSSQR